MPDIHAAEIKNILTNAGVYGILKKSYNLSSLAS